MSVEANIAPISTTESEVSDAVAVYVLPFRNLLVNVMVEPASLNVPVSVADANVEKWSNPSALYV